MGENKNHLFTFSFKLILFLLILAVLVFKFIIPYVPDIGNDGRYVYVLNKFNKSKENTFDIAFFGNSYSFTAYDPTLIKNKLNLNAIHLNSGAQHIKTSLIIATDAIEKQNLKYIFFEISGASLRTPDTTQDVWYYQTLALQETPLSLNKIKNIYPYFPVKKYPKNYVSSLSKNLGRWFRINEIDDYRVSIEDTFKSKSESVYFSYNGFIANHQFPISEKLYKKEFYRKAYKGNEQLWTRENIEKFKMLFQKAKEKGVEVILLQSIKLYPTDIDTSTINQFLEEYDNVHYIDLNANRNSYDLNAKSFYNSTHVNYRASYQTTNRLIDSLSNWFEIPKRENPHLKFNDFVFTDFFYSLDPSQDQFVKFEFEDIPKSLENHTLVISLFPKDRKYLRNPKNMELDSDNFYIKDFQDQNIFCDIGTSKVIIKKLDSKINKTNIKEMKIYFYKKGDTLKLPTISISNFN